LFNSRCQIGSDNLSGNLFLSVKSIVKQEF
jgi:hypothetical protein